ncbi:MAG: hypothetical protein ACKORA_07725, partial [Solirubrobacterales bacterium]
FPPTRYLVRIIAIALFAGRFRWAAAGATWGGRAWEAWRVRGRDFDIEGEAVEVTLDPSAIPARSEPTGRPPDRRPPPSLPGPGDGPDA